MVPVKKHPRKKFTPEQKREITRARVQALRLSLALQHRIHWLRADRQKALNAAAASYEAPKGWTRIGLISNAADELCVLIGKGTGKSRKYREISVSA